jgi:hypothetical protein
MTAKTVNYTQEQTEAMVTAYVANPTKETVAALATEMGKTVRSIVAKLSREQVYKVTEKTTKAGDPIVKKDAAALEIGKYLNMTDGEIESLSKANKTALVKILTVVKDAVELNIGEDFTTEEA